jgi:hypothetical protein
MGRSAYSRRAFKARDRHRRNQREQIHLYVQADTVVRWHRERFRRFWARLSKPQRWRRGRPGTAAEFRRLIEQMAAANPLCPNQVATVNPAMLAFQHCRRSSIGLLQRLRQHGFRTTISNRCRAEATSCPAPLQHAAPEDSWASHRLALRICEQLRHFELLN